MSPAWIRIFFWSYLLILVVACATFTNPADPDLWHRLAVGETLCTTGHFPAGDTFSYLADYQDGVDHEWGSAVVFYSLYRLGGMTAIILIKIVTLAVTLALLVRAGMQGRRYTALSAAFYALILLVLLPSFQSTVRCMTFTHVFLALWLYWFQRERHGRPVSAWLYPATMLLWANLHGGFAIGLAWLAAVLVAAYVRAWLSASNAPAPAFWSPKKWALRFALCALVTLINPFGLRLWTFTLRALTVTRSGFGEWARVDWSNPGAYPSFKLLLLGLLAALTLAIVRRGWRQLDRASLALIALFIALSLTSARHTSLFAAVAGALAPGLFPQRPITGDEYDENLFRRLGRRILIVAAVVVPLLTPLVLRSANSGLTLEYKPDSCPVAAVDYLKAHDIRGRLLVPFNYGSYALWQLRGKMRVSMDGRYDLVYTPATYARVDDFFRARGDWKTLLTTPAPDAILTPVDAPVYPQLKADRAWEETWHNDIDAVFLPVIKN